MILTIKIILIIFMVIAFMGAIADDNKQTREYMIFVLFASMASLVALVLFA